MRPPLDIRSAATWLLLLSTLFVLMEFALGLTCPSLDTCDPATQCEPPVPCRGGTVKDVCGCCDTCAKVRGEECGGMHDLKGKCDSGLTCVLQPATPEGTSSSEGVCLGPESTSCASLVRYVGCDAVDGNCVCEEKLACTDPGFEFASRDECRRNVAADILGRKELPSYCRGVSCNNILPSCPVDSMPRYGDVPSGECCAKPGTCLCDPHSCQVPKCDDASHELVLKKSAKGRPGECCNVYECLYSGANCSLVTCPSHDRFQCPDDSYALPSVLSLDGCCFRPQGCACLPTPCVPVKCSATERLKILRTGSRTPGSCCTRFHCIKEGEPTCQYDGEEYIEGHTWKSDKCTSCTCKGNVTFCSSVQCNVTSYCGRMEVPEGDCCPICTGCVSSSGAAYDNGQTWQQDDCTTCTCVDGKPSCHAEFCSVQCTNPRRIPGQCCPHCDEPLTVTVPPECPALENCTEMCFVGHRKDGNGCYVCDCHLDGCDLQCDFGYAVDDDGQVICKCRCPTLDDCDKHCLHGFKSDANGCRICKCAKCRSLKCAKKCPYGHVRNDRGCRTCKCLNGSDKEIETTDAHFYNITTEVTEITRSPTEETCEVNGELRDEGEMWHDGCRNCYCHAGQEMCGLITCPVPRCEDPFFYSGDCCPKCMDGASAPPSANITVCQSSDHSYRVEGETWELDSCTSCICHSGQVLCQSKRCPPTACLHPVHNLDECCPMCPAIEAKSGAVCVTEDGGSSYEDGAMWQVAACHSCRCLNGKIECFSARCPQLKCAVPVLLKGKCCPLCLSDTKHPPLCLHNNIQYVSGEMWSDDGCKQCVCLDGRTQCRDKPCPVDCQQPVAKVPGQCCSGCQDSTSAMPPHWPDLAHDTVNWTPTTTQIDVHGKPTERTGQDVSPVVVGLSVALALLVAAVLITAVCCYKQRKSGRFIPGNKKVGDQHEFAPIYKNNINGKELNGKNFTSNSGYIPVNKV